MFTSTSSNLKKYIFSVFIGFLLTALIAVIRASSYPNYLDDLKINEQTYFKATSKDLDIAIIGDSRCLFNLSPREFKRTKLTDKKIHNLCYIHQTMNTSYLEFVKKKLAPDGEKIIIISLTPLSLLAQSNKSLEEEVNLNHSVLLRKLNHYEKKIQYYLKPYNFSNRQTTVKKSVHENGWIQIKSTLYIDKMNTLPEYVNAIKNYGDKESLTQPFLKKILEWKEENFKVFILPITSSKNIMEQEKKINSFNFYSFLNQIEKNGITVLKTEIPEQSIFYDGDHLLGKDAVIYSSQVVKEISQYLNKQ